jgi:ABC-type Fe3+ transport system substrate-binding protein
MSARPSRIVVASALAALAWLLSASHPVSAEDWTTSPQIRDLYEKAKAEKEVNYWGQIEYDLVWAGEYFNKRFPGIKVNVVADPQGPTKMIAESRSGKISADVTQQTLGSVLEVQKRGLLAKVDWSLAGVEPRNVLLDGEAGAMHNFVYSILYANDKVQTADLPKTWEDLLDPKWKGKLVISDFLFPRLMGFLALEWGPDRAEKWGRELIDKQNILVTNAPRENFLKTGERLLAIAEGVQAAGQYKREGVDTGYVIMNLIPAGQFLIAALKDGQHPNAGKLMALWLASDEGKALRAKVVDEPDIRPGSKAELAAEIQKAGAKVLFEDMSNFNERAEYYKRFSPMTRGM